MANLMEATAVKEGIGDEALNSGQRLKNLQKRPGIEGMKQLARKGGQSIRSKDPPVASLVPVLFVEGLLRFRKFEQASFCRGYGQKVVDDNMGKWLGRPEAGPELICLMELK